MTEPLRIGILCPSDIASRRFLPALEKCPRATFAGIACAAANEWYGEPTPELLSRERERACATAQPYGARVYNSYDALLSSPDLDAVYLPMPPALHARFAQIALLHGKHVFLEKPATTSAADTLRLVSIARERGLALRENYHFLLHRQIGQIEHLLADGAVGQIRLHRLSFGFPHRGAQDFRYDPALGGGALLDCGGYPLALAAHILGESAHVDAATLSSPPGCAVDLYGSATLHAPGAPAPVQISFGMDCAYRCSWEIWGSRGILTCARVFTSPADLAPPATLTIDGETSDLSFFPDDGFLRSLEAFCDDVADPAAREREYTSLLRQASLVDSLRAAAQAAT